MHCVIIGGMWVVIAFPPLTWQLGTRRPVECPTCGDHRMDVHGHRSRRLGTVQPIVGGAPQFHRQSATRFRCRACRRTVTPADVTRGPRPRVPPNVATKVVVHYALGWRVDRILEYLAETGTPISRGTLNRVLRSVDGPSSPGGGAGAALVLRALHIENRRSMLRRGRRTTGPGGCQRPWRGSYEIAPVGELGRLAEGRGRVLRPGREPALYITRWPVMVFRLRPSNLRWNTLGWLHEYLKRLGAGGIYTWRTRRDLASAIPTDQPLARHRSLPENDTTFGRPEDVRLVPMPAAVRAAVVFALRAAESGSAPGAFDEDDVFDPERRERWCTRCQLRLGADEPCPNDASHRLVAWPPPRGA